MKKSFLVLIFLTLLISVSFAENIDDVLKELKYQKERVKEFEEKEEETKQYQFEYISRSQLIPESKRKLLAFTLDEPAIIPFGSAQNSTYTQHAYQYVFTKIHPYKSRFIMYPYSFSHTIDSTLETFSEGAFFNIDPSDMPDEDDPDNFFNYFLLSDSIDLTKAKALYDGSIAVLRVEDNFNGFDQDLTYEGYYYCDAMRTYLGKWSQCLTYDEWEATNFTYMGATRFLYFTPENIQNNKLSQSYPLFIIPDIIAHSEDVIMDRLNTTGQTNIVNYVNQGGYVIGSGKASILLEKLGLITANTMDTSRTLIASEYNAGVKNCDSFVSGALEFTHRMICFSSKNTDGSRDASVISPYMPTFPVADPGLTIMTRFDPTTSTLSWKDAETGYVTSIPQSGSNYFPMTMHKFVGEGQILLNFGSSVMKSSHYFWFYNMFFAAFARPLLLDIEVSDDLEQIPALETLSLSANHRFRNLYTDGLTDIRFYSFVVYGVEWVGSAPAGCVYGTNYPSPPSTSIDPSKYLNCSATISSVSESDFMLNFHIYDPLVTQAGTSVMLIYNMYTYTDPVTGDSRTYYPGGLYFDAAMAALLRCDYNPDPSAIYPIKGEGNYIDDVLHTENKEDTMALEVVHYAIVPLISPVVDGNEQAIIAHEIDLDWVYYNTRTNGTTGYIYPFEDNLEDYDFLLYPVLAEKHSVLAADWDTPVKIDKDLCTFNETAGLSLSDVQSAMYQTNIESVGTQVKQRYFKDADVYFEHATQRLLVFCDLTTPEGALEFYGSVGAILNPVPGQNYQKTKLLFVRNDIYFYEYEGYPLPEGVENSSYVITIDRYPPDPANCTPGLYNARADILVPGFFDSTQYPGLVANEYSNEILMNCDRIKKFYTDFGSSSDVEVTHYLIPFVDNTTTVDDLMYFQSNGSYEDYPELQFITPHGSTFELDPADTRKGGMLIIQHPSLSFTAGTIPEKAITLSCDQVAVYDINYVSGNRSFIVKFKRGNMPNEAYGKNSQMEVNIENITTSASFNITMAIWSLVYDLEQPAPHETYNYNQTLQIELVQRPCLSFPALKLAFKLRRGQYENESYINPYEFLEPFVRFGIFLQELRAHRTIWGSLEVHPVSDPGLVGRSGGFSTITHVGTSSIPFREYLTTGASQVIPAASETGRVEWTDIWGRRWVQPVRSLFLDVPPIPPPLKNFIMSTTFELMTKSGERLMEWRTDDEVDVFVKLKLLNNYPKYFEITTCENNRYNQYVKYGNLRDRHFTPPDPATLYEGGASDVFIRQGHSAKYGDCFNIIGQTITLSGKVLTDENKTNIALAQLCSEEDYQDYSDSCQQIDFTTLPTISRRPDNSTYVWNYAPLINSYYAPGYIWADMWDLTHVDYDDNPMDKAYKYHMDNNLPNIDKGIIRPHNIIAFPIWKGLGYSVTYDRTYSNPRYASKYGWWTDNLQNRDDTLVAGQNTCNNVSVDKQDSTLTAYGGPGWILINDLQELISNTSGLNIAEEKEKNIYTCMFNRHRIKITGKSKSSYVDNVYQNNVVPVIPSLTKYDDRLTNFDCSSVPDQYTPDNISSVDNRVYTDSARDWLYFASNLRGGAKETINVVYSIKPIEDVLFESLHAKVQDGGRFTYWNPANGPNSFLVVDNPVSTVIATRSDISIYEEVFPASTTTFQSLVLNLLEIYDENEINRKYTDAIWMNHHGFGDSAISTYVGVGGSSSVLATTAGTETYIKVEFTNNAGFDWNMYQDAIEAIDLEDKPINGNDLLFHLVHDLKKPTKYNFMTVHIPAELQDYVEIVPSEHAIMLAPLFFDFESINVATIRDGFKGMYYYKFNITQDIPSSLTGRLFEFTISLNQTYFDHLPGYNDLAPSIHDYTLTIPSFKIGFPDASGNIYYTSGYSSNLQLTQVIPSTFTATGARFVTSSDIQQLRLISTNDTNKYSQLNEFFNNLTSVCPITTQAQGSNTLVTYNLGSITEFPIKQANGHDQAWLYILLAEYSDVLPFGRTAVSNSALLLYDDFKDYEKNDTITTPYYVDARGAWTVTSVEYTLVTPQTLAILDPQYLFANQQGAMNSTVTITNTGSDMAHEVSFYLLFSPEITNIRFASQFSDIQTFTNESGTTYIINSHIAIAPGDFVGLGITFDFGPDGTVHDNGDGTSTRVFILNLDSEFDITPTSGELRVLQSFPDALSVILTPGSPNGVYLEYEEDDDHKLTFHAYSTITFPVEYVTYIFRKRVIKPEEGSWETFYVGNSSTATDDPTSTLDTGEDIEVEYTVLISSMSVEAAQQSPESATVLAESNVVSFSLSPANLLFLLFLLGVIPIGAAVFFFYRHKKKKRENAWNSTHGLAPTTSAVALNRDGTQKSNAFQQNRQAFVEREMEMDEMVREQERWEEEKKQRGVEITHHEVTSKFIATGVVPLNVISSLPDHKK